MASTFEIATRAAIEEMITKHGQESKFGVILTKDGVRELVDDLYLLLQTSRDLKSAGDRFLRQQQQPAAVKPKNSQRTRPT